MKGDVSRPKSATLDSIRRTLKEAQLGKDDRVKAMKRLAKLESDR